MDIGKLKIGESVIADDGQRTRKLEELKRLEQSYHNLRVKWPTGMRAHDDENDEKAKRLKQHIDEARQKLGLPAYAGLHFSGGPKAAQEEYNSLWAESMRIGDRMNEVYKKDEHEYKKLEHQAEEISEQMRAINKAYPHMKASK